MPECVTVQIEAPTAWSEGSVTEGYYVLDGDKLTMTFANGEPVKIDDQLVERTLVGGEDPRLVAGRLVREIRQALNPEKVIGFARSISYSNEGRP
jgi:hypothetical protein